MVDLGFTTDSTLHYALPMLRRGGELFKAELSVRGVLLALGLASGGWLLAAPRRPQAGLLLWLLVPLLALSACVCVAGPGRWYSKAHEGPILFWFNSQDAFTALDALGLLLFAGALLLAGTLALWRLRPFVAG